VGPAGGRGTLVYRTRNLHPIQFLTGAKNACMRRPVLGWALLCVGSTTAQSQKLLPVTEQNPRNLIVAAVGM
jgi:hypothetical protein